MMIYLKHLDNDSQYHVIGIVNNKVSLILIDTGACMSHITADLVSEVYEAENKFTYKDFLGQSHVQDKLSEIEIILSSNLQVKMEILVDYQEKYSEVLLGINFLECFNYTIRKNELSLKLNEEEVVLPRIRLNPHTIRKVIKQ